jgi:O-antigen/teichoic acid export membrane protein
MNVSWKSKSLSGLKPALLANFVGTGWAALVQLACLPLYIRFLGIEAFGLIGFYLMVQAMLQVLDFGLSPTMNREMARYSVQPEKAAEARDLVRSLEVGYWLIGLVIGGVLLAGAPWIASHWIKAGTMPFSSVRQALMLMAVLAVFQWPVSFYQGGLMGLHRQVLLNTLRVVGVTLSYGGSILILWLVAPTIQAFLLWTVAINAAQVLTLAIVLWKSLPPTGRPPKFDFTLVRNIGRFAAGMSGITLTSLILTQIDKLLVSKLLPLKIFGYYTLAWAVANGLSLVVVAVFNVFYPRMSAQVAAGDEVGVKHSYHRGSQLMATLVLPTAAVLFIFAFDFLRLWTGSSETARNAAPVVSILVIGTAINGVLHLPYALQLAFGWTKLNFLAGVVSSAVVMVAIFPMTRYFGPVGAATVWAMLNVMNMFIVVPIMHRRLLRDEFWGYYRDVGFPLISSIATAALGRFIFPNFSSTAMTFVTLCSVWLGSLIAAVLTAPQVRIWTIDYLTKQKTSYA